MACAAAQQCHRHQLQRPRLAPARSWQTARKLHSQRYRDERMKGRCLSPLHYQGIGLELNQTWLVIPFLWLAGKPRLFVMPPAAESVNKKSR